MKTQFIPVNQWTFLSSSHVPETHRYLPDRVAIVSSPWAAIDSCQRACKTALSHFLGSPGWLWGLSGIPRVLVVDAILLCILLYIYESITWFKLISNLYVDEWYIRNMHECKYHWDASAAAFPVAMSSNTEPVPCCGRRARCLAAPQEVGNTTLPLHSLSKLHNHDITRLQCRGRYVLSLLRFPESVVFSWSLKETPWNCPMRFLEALSTCTYSSPPLPLCMSDI